MTNMAVYRRQEAYDSIRDILRSTHDGGYTEIFLNAT